MTKTLARDRMSPAGDVGQMLLSLSLLLSLTLSPSLTFPLVLSASHITIRTIYITFIAIDSPIYPLPISLSSPLFSHISGFPFQALLFYGPVQSDSIRAWRRWIIPGGGGGKSPDRYNYNALSWVALMVGLVRGDAATTAGE